MVSVARNIFFDYFYPFDYYEKRSEKRECIFVNDNLDQYLAVTENLPETYFCNGHKTDAKNFYSKAESVWSDVKPSLERMPPTVKKCIDEMGEVCQKHIYVSTCKEGYRVLNRQKIFYWAITIVALGLLFSSSR